MPKAAPAAPDVAASESATCRPADPVVKYEGWEEGGPSDHPVGKGKGRRRRTCCPVCWQRVSNVPAALSQHQYWNEECLAWSFYNNGVPWRQARRRALDLKEQREEDYYGVEEPTVPAPSLAATVWRLRCMYPTRIRRKRRRKRKRRSGIADIAIIVRAHLRKLSDAKGLSGLLATMTRTRTTCQQ